VTAQHMFTLGVTRPSPACCGSQKSKF